MVRMDIGRFGRGFRREKQALQVVVDERVDKEHQNLLEERA